MTHDADDRPLAVPLAPKLALFDPDGDLVRQASEIGRPHEGCEDEAVGTFWSHYLLHAPSRFHPSADVLRRLRLAGGRDLRTMFGISGKQGWTEGMLSYWTLAYGKVAAIHWRPFAATRKA